MTSQLSGYYKNQYVAGSTNRVIDQPTAVGRDAAAQAVGINRSLAAFHLDRLTEAGLLKAGYRRLSGRTGPGAGRPARIYERGARTIELSMPIRRYERAADLFATALEGMAGRRAASRAEARRRTPWRRVGGKRRGRFGCRRS